MERKPPHIRARISRPSKKSYAVEEEKHIKMTKFSFLCNFLSIIN